MLRRSALSTATAITLAATASLALTACGSDSLDTPSTAGKAAGTDSAPATQTVDAALAAKVPAAIKAKGTVTVGSDASYAPNEFMGADGQTVTGMDVDLFAAAMQKLGLKAEFTNAEFPSIILGVTSGKYDVGVSSLTINDERKKQVTMVQYFNAGTLWAVKKGNPTQVDPDKACGLKVGVQKGTVQVDDLAARSKKCTDGGRPAITTVVETEQSKVTADLVSGKVEAMAADSPVTNYAIKQTSGQLEVVGTMYDSAPYGIVVPKAQADFAQVISEAYAALARSGDYRKILDRWNNADGGVSSFTVNP
ncbi:ABC transporter substrate-binding protein [Arsenicicoccus dermatophilus]|uniref:ABC transporter substrate-binding protein n=1 Tax=Arsenicicoccus dermatophilus TaxID=1076331 RepID=UPI001F4CA01D|nr:ABC transporter substrate-binding protein [Arsenicicoccus dermatophilus]